MKRIEDRLRDLWDKIKCTNIRIIGVPEEEEKKKTKPTGTNKQLYKGFRIYGQYMKVNFFLIYQQ